jgi:hypothetical protein
MTGPVFVPRPPLPTAREAEPGRALPRSTSRPIRVNEATKLINALNAAGQPHANVQDAEGKHLADKLHRNLVRRLAIDAGLLESGGST